MTHQVFCTAWNSHMEDGHGGKFVEYAVSGVHTEAAANRYCAVLTAVSKSERHGRKMEFEVKRVRA